MHYQVKKQKGFFHKNLGPTPFHPSATMSHSYVCHCPFFHYSLCVLTKINSYVEFVASGISKIVNFDAETFMVVSYTFSENYPPYKNTSSPECSD